MESFVKADIFFFVSTMALVIVSIALVIALVYLIKILSQFLSLSKKIKEEGEEAVDDFHSFRETIKKEGKGMRWLWKGFINFISDNKKAGVKPTSNKKNEKTKKQKK